MVAKKKQPAPSKDARSGSMQCRCCREDLGEEFDSIFQYEDLCSTLEILTGIPIEKATLHSAICSNCKMLLEVVEDFRKTSLAAAQFFQQLEAAVKDEGEDFDERGEWEDDNNPLEYLGIKRKDDDQIKARKSKRISQQPTKKKIKQEHRVRKLEPVDYFGCHFCPEKRFRNKDVLRHHLYQNHFQPKVICDFCGADFQGKYKLQLHMEACHMPDSEKNTRSYTCAKCGTVCDGLKAFKRHRISKHYQNRKVPCDECGKSLLVTSLPNHKKHLHNSGYSHVCDLCGQRFRIRWDLVKHLKTHPTEYDCPHCDKKFLSRRAQRDHIRYSHEIEGNEVYCPICGKGFKRSRYLKRHIESHTRSDPRPADIFVHPCDECDMRFQKLEQLSKHKRLHERKRIANLTCKYCLKVCRSENHLTTHQHRHAGTWPVSCPICSKGFALTRDLDNHMRVHKIEPDTLEEEDEDYDALIETIVEDEPETEETYYEIEALDIEIPKKRPPIIKVIGVSDELM